MYQFEEILDKTVLLYSGGMDSYICNKLFKPDVKLYIKLGTKTSEQEYIRNLKQKDIQIIDFKSLKIFEMKDAQLPMRNAFLLMLGAFFGNKIMLGTLKGEGSRDKDFVFQGQLNSLINYTMNQYNNNKYEILYPVKDYTKYELLKYYKDKGGDIEDVYLNSFSCYTPENNKECGKCWTCCNKWVAFANINFIKDKDRIFEVKKHVEYCLHNKHNMGILEVNKMIEILDNFDIKYEK